MRGTHREQGRGCARPGIIPAYAGNTLPRSRLVSAVWDHPRICGEHDGSNADALMHRGSSPHMRGTQIRAVLLLPHGGIIPAYAGNTRSRHRALLNDGDHPRICGEHFPQTRIDDFKQGSSPHMRGTRGGTQRARIPVGIIPAYAGNTPSRPHISAQSRDHPRICGEHCEYAHKWGVRKGSSPHMRGTLDVITQIFLAKGIIPAYAGNTVRSAIHAFYPRDHPRICGEHNSEGYQRSRRQGSSPHMRGTHDRQTHPLTGLGIIPAYAGNTR